MRRHRRSTGRQLPGQLLGCSLWEVRLVQLRRRRRGGGNCAEEAQMAATDSRGENVRVAVLGTGIMGSAMARNLVSAGLRTTVWDRSPAATAPLSGAGALVAATPAEAVQDARVVITMLPTAEVVNSVMFAGGVVGALAEGVVWAQMGTIGLGATTEIGSRL